MKERSKSAFAGASGFWPADVVILQQALCLSASGQYQMTTPDEHEREHGSTFSPRFDVQGLVTAVVVDATSKQVLMVAHMDDEALAKTRETGLAHFHSRSRGRFRTRVAAHLRSSRPLAGLVRTGRCKMPRKLEMNGTLRRPVR